MPFRSVKFRLLAFLAILAPGFITANVDNDPGGILTYSQAGAKFGYALLWTLIPIYYRPDHRSGNGCPHGCSYRQRASPDLIREEFGFSRHFFTTFILGLAGDFGEHHELSLPEFASRHSVCSGSANTLPYP